MDDTHVEKDLGRIRDLLEALERLVELIIVVVLEGLDPCFYFLTTNACKSWAPAELVGVHVSPYLFQRHADSRVLQLKKAHKASLCGPLGEQLSRGGNSSWWVWDRVVATSGGRPCVYGGVACGYLNVPVLGAKKAVWQGLDQRLAWAGRQQGGWLLRVSSGLDKWAVLPLLWKTVRSSPLFSTPNCSSSPALKRCPRPSGPTNGNWTDGHEWSGESMTSPYGISGRLACDGTTASAPSEVTVLQLASSGDKKVHSVCSSSSN